MGLLIGLAALILILALAKGFSAADPKGLAKGARYAGGVVLAALGAFLTLRGQFGIGLPIGLAGLGMLGVLPFGAASLGRRTQKSPGQVSRVRAACVEMELDHDSGAMRGRVLAGRCAGAALDDLDEATLVGLLAEFDEESRTLLAAYLDRRSPRWREHAQAGDTAGESRAASSGKMTEQEAYQILGLEPGASPEEVGRAHRLLMKKLHPDQGGSTWLAARVNEAKEVLLRGHR